MNYENAVIFLVVLCITGATVSVIGEWLRWRAIRMIFKIAASTAFVALALVNGAADSGYGRLILIALGFSWVGDALLLSKRSSYLLAGIAAFFFAHVSFAIAFVSQSLDIGFFVIAATIMCVVAVVMLRWLWPHLDPFYKIAVPVYVIAITLMTSLAVGASSPPMPPLLAIAAITFTASDVSVARDRFIANEIVNRAWGMPLYYIAQILFAMSVLFYK